MDSRRWLDKVIISAKKDRFHGKLIIEVVAGEVVRERKGPDAAGLWGGTLCH